MYLHLEVLAGTHGYLKDGAPLRATSIFMFCFRTSAQHSRPGGEPWWASQISQRGGGDSHLGNFTGCHGNCTFSLLPTGLLGGMLLNSVSPPTHPTLQALTLAAIHVLLYLGSDPRPRSAEWAPRQTVKSEVEWREGSHQMVWNMTETEIEPLAQTGCLGGTELRRKEGRHAQLGFVDFWWTQEDWGAIASRWEVSGGWIDLRVLNHSN